MEILVAIIIIFFPLAFLIPVLLTLVNNGRGKNPPGPPKLPIIGNIHQLQLPLHRCLGRMSAEYGSIIHLMMGSSSAVVISSADLAKQFTRDHDLDCCSRPKSSFFHKLSYEGADVAFAPYNESWRRLRKICSNKLYSNPKGSPFRAVRESEVRRLLASIDSDLSTDFPAIDLAKKLVSLTNSVACKMAFGGGGGFTGKKYDLDWLSRVLSERQKLSSAFFAADWIPWLGWVDRFNGVRNRLDRLFNEFDCYYGDVIRERMAEHHDDDGDDDGNDILDTLLKLRKDPSQHLTFENIKAIIMDIFIGGTETSSSLIEWAMAELMKNPECMKKAQEEVRSVVGRRGEVNESDIHCLKYLHMVVIETLRLHPPIPLLVPREVIRNFEVDGYDIHAKTKVIINAWAISRDAKYWEKSEDFFPERFMNSYIDTKGQNFQLIPFGAGRRMCPGANLGLSIAELTLANLLYSYNWALMPNMCKDELDMTEAPGLLAKRKFPLFLMASKYASM